MVRGPEISVKKRLGAVSAAMIDRAIPTCWPWIKDDGTMTVEQLLEDAQNESIGGTNND